MEFLQLTLENLSKSITYLLEYNYLTASVIVTQLKRPPGLMFCISGNANDDQDDDMQEIL